MDRDIIDPDFRFDTQKVMNAWPRTVRLKLAEEIRRVQNGDAPLHWKPLPQIKKGLREIRVKVDTNIYRTVYIIMKGGVVTIVDAFQKKNQKMSKKDRERIKQRLKQIG